MDKEKEIEEMAMSIAECNGTTCDNCRLKCNKYITCEILHKKGYGNVEQAVKDFAKKLKEELWKFDGSWQEYDGEELCETVDNLITELYGADE